MAKKRPGGNRLIRRTRDDERHAKKLSQLQARLLRSLRKGVPGIKRVDQITHDNVHLIHERMEVIREQIQELRSHHGPNASPDCSMRPKAGIATGITIAPNGSPPT